MVTERSLKLGTRAMAWSAADILLRQGLQFAVMVVLARLITPAEFGTVAVLALFTGIAGVVVDAGLSTALIQRRDITHVDESTVFWANLSLAGTMAGILALLAPWLAGFYSQPGLQALTYVMAANVFVNALTAVHVAMLTKRLDFRPILHAGLLGSLLSGGVAVVMALRGHGTAALVGQAMTMSVVTAAVLWWCTDWRPLRVFDRDSARRLFGFGSYVFLANLSDIVFLRLYTLLAGKLFGIREVGLYNRAEATQQFPVELVSSIAARVALPMLSATESTEQFRQGVRTGLRSLMVVNVPLLLGLAAVAQPAVALVLGDQWDAVVPLLQILCIAGALWPIHMMNVQALMARGQARLALILEVVKKSVGVTVLVLGAATLGLEGLAWGQVVFGLFAVVANTHYTGKLIGYGLAAQVRDVAPAFLAALPGSAIAWAMASTWNGPAGLVLTSAVVAGGLSYLLVVQVFRVSAFTELRRHLRQS